jgi:hypothetical protein
VCSAEGTARGYSIYRVSHCLPYKPILLRSQNQVILKLAGVAVIPKRVKKEERRGGAFDCFGGS